MIKKMVGLARRRSREKRSLLFRDHMSFINPDTKILDLGSEDGTNIYNVLGNLEYNPKNVYIADIDETAINKGNEFYGFTPVIINEDDEKLPFDDLFFDVVYCSSVIEHVTASKEKVWRIRNGKEFSNISLLRQRQFANEIKRVGKSYFIQTPNKHFPIETHTWFPFVAYMPRPTQIWLINLLNRFWIKQTTPDFYLLNRSQFKSMFEEASIIPEKSLSLFNKSWIAINIHAHPNNSQTHAN